MVNATLLLLTEEITSLDDVRKLILSINKREEIRKLNTLEYLSLSEEDKSTISKWQEGNSSEIYKQSLSNGKEVSFIVEEAYIESPKLFKNMFKNKELLSRPERISTDVIKSVFYEIDNRVFCIIFSISTTILKKIKNKLFDDELFISSLDLSHMVDSDLFYWLLYKYEYNDKIIDTNFEIEAIEGFIGNIADDNNIIKGTSEVTPSLLVTKAFVSKFHPITNLNMILKFEDYKLSFMINTTCQCLLSSTCIIPNIKYDVDISALIILYADIIPKLIEDYELEKTKDIWNREIKKSFAKKVGIDVIRDIAKFHDIKISINEESKTQALG